MNVQEFLKSERQWSHTCRVGYAQSQLDKAVTEQERNFWRSVLDANKK